MCAGRSSRRACTVSVVAVAVLLLLVSAAVFTHRAWQSQNKSSHSMNNHSPRKSCNGTLAAHERVIVATRCGEDTTWLSLYFPEIQRIVYQLPCAGTQDLDTNKQLPNDNAHESQAMLTYVVENYSLLPASMLFIHGHRHRWHMHDKVPIISGLRWENVQFANLRYKNFTHWDCPDQLPVFAGCDWVGNTLTPGKPRQDPSPPHHREDISHWFSMYWTELFGHELGPLPELVRGPCCGEMLVHANRVLRHPLAFYRHLLSVIQAAEGAKAEQIGYMMEYCWHIIWGRQHVWEPVEMCDLLRCFDD